MSTSTAIDGPHDAPDRIGPDYSPKRTAKEQFGHVVRAFTTKQGLVGTYDYSMFFSTVYNYNFGMWEIKGSIE